MLQQGQLLEHARAVYDSLKGELQNALDQMFWASVQYFALVPDAPIMQCSLVFGEMRMWDSAEVADLLTPFLERTSLEVLEYVGAHSRI